VLKGVRMLAKQANIKRYSKKSKQELLDELDQLITMGHYHVTRMVIRRR
jgi:hypothetical protein